MSLCTCYFSFSEIGSDAPVVDDRDRGDPLPLPGQHGVGNGIPDGALGVVDLGQRLQGPSLDRRVGDHLRPVCVESILLSEHKMKSFSKNNILPLFACFLNGRSHSLFVYFRLFNTSKFKI